MIKVSLNLLKSTKNQHVQAGNTSVHFTIQYSYQEKMSHATPHPHFLFPLEILIGKQDTVRRLKGADWWLLSVSGQKSMEILCCCTVLSMVSCERGLFSAQTLLDTVDRGPGSLFIPDLWMAKEMDTDDAFHWQLSSNEKVKAFMKMQCDCKKRIHIYTHTHSYMYVATASREYICVVTAIKYRPKQGQY